MIQRYEFYNSEPSDIGPYYDPCDNGDWVQYSDHESHIIKLSKKVDEYKDLAMNLHDFLTLLKDHNNPKTKPVFSRNSLNAWINTYHKKIADLEALK